MKLFKINIINETFILNKYSYGLLQIWNIKFGKIINEMLHFIGTFYSFTENVKWNRSFIVDNDMEGGN